MTETPDFRHIDAWLFDLDYTLYPADCPLNALVETRMDAYVQRVTGLTLEEAQGLRDEYYRTHGTTMAGLIRHHAIDPHHYIADVQDVEMDCVRPDPLLRAAIARLPGRRLVFTNAGEKYAHKVLAALQLDDLFEDVFHIEAAQFIPTPQPEPFAAIIAKHGLDPKVTAFFEDNARNLKPAAELGMSTILVGPHALATPDTFVHHRTDDLPAFLASARIKETL
jgi:putative hydrolase of the HAD superfamily